MGHSSTLQDNQRTFLIGINTVVGLELKSCGINGKKMNSFKTKKQEKY